MELEEAVCYGDVVVPSAASLAPSSMLPEPPYAVACLDRAWPLQAERTAQPRRRQPSYPEGRAPSKARGPRKPGLSQAGLTLPNPQEPYLKALKKAGLNNLACDIQLLDYTAGWSVHDFCNLQQIFPSAAA